MERKRLVAATVSVGATLAVLAVSAAGCARIAPSTTLPLTSAPGAFTAGSPTADSPCGVLPKAPQYQHIVWIVMENHGSHQVVNAPDAPYLNGLAGKCGLATNFHAIAHPSLPNYIALTSGSTQGITDDGSPAAHPLDVPSIFAQLGAGRWRALAESMPGNCSRQDSGDYATRHNPPVYYTSIATQCDQQDVPLGAAPDISAPLTFVAPNLSSDMHDTTVSYGDNWLRSFIPALLNTDQYKAATTAIFITFDEDEKSKLDPNTSNGKGNQIPTIVISPSTPAGLQSSEFFTHYSMLRTAEEAFGLELLGEAKQATSMADAFNLG